MPSFRYRGRVAGDHGLVTAVLVHGVPETDAVWEPLRDALGRDDVVCLSPPGFGAPVPGGFGASAAEYRDWLMGELERFPEPVDLVGHDWGGGHVMQVAMTRPELLRSWVSDATGVFEPDYVWHDLAQAWQRPGAGEELVDVMMNAPVAQRAARLVELGVTPEVARGMATGQGEEMGRCILAPATGGWFRTRTGPPGSSAGSGTASADRGTADGGNGLRGRPIDRSAGALTAGSSALPPRALPNRDPRPDAGTVVLCNDDLVRIRRAPRPARTEFTGSRR
jgi:pimeloyl-ACP methyl ester carboxylesterase